jgi:V/A-type H+-transporting ATPase subunit E
MRWNLVRDVERHLKARMQDLMADESAYLGLLQGLLSAAARQIEGPELVVEANAADHKRLSAAWAALSETAAPGRRLTLTDDPINTLGGVLVRDTDNRVRVDNTFEGRLDRLRPRVQQVILERLLPSGFDTGNLFTG